MDRAANKCVRTVANGKPGASQDGTVVAGNAEARLALLHRCAWIAVRDTSFYTVVVAMQRLSDRRRICAMGMPNRHPEGRSRTVRRAKMSYHLRPSVAARRHGTRPPCQRTKRSAFRRRSDVGTHTAHGFTCFVPTALRDQTRTSYHAIQQLFLPIGTRYQTIAPAQPAVAADRCAPRSRLF